MTRGSEVGVSSLWSASQAPAPLHSANRPVTERVAVAIPPVGSRQGPDSRARPGGLRVPSARPERPVSQAQEEAENPVTPLTFSEHFTPTVQPTALGTEPQPPSSGGLPVPLLDPPRTHTQPLGPPGFPLVSLEPHLPSCPGQRTCRAPRRGTWGGCLGAPA